MTIPSDHGRWCHGCNDVAAPGHTCKDPDLRRDDDPAAATRRPLPLPVWGCILIAAAVLGVDIDAGSGTLTFLLRLALTGIAYTAMRAIYVLGYADGVKDREDGA